MQNRLYTIDALKAFGIFCIVLGHNNYAQAGNYIYSFHIPLFLFVSGLMFDVNRYKSIGNFIKRRFQNILIPYFLISFLLYIFWFFAGRKFGSSVQMELSPLKNFIGIFYAQGENEYMDWGIQMWFLPCLFLISVIYFYLARYNNKIIIAALVLSGITGYFLPNFLERHLPWSIDIVFTAILFYGTGHLLREFLLDNILVHKKSATTIFILIIALCFNIVFFYLNGKIDISKGIYNNYLYMYLSGIGGSVFYLLLLNYLPRIKIVSYIGINTLLIMAFHLRAMTLIKFIQIYILHIEFNMTVFLSFFYSFLQLGLLIPLIWLINKYFPLLAGKGIRAKNT